MWNSLIERLERLFNVSDDLQNDLSHKWRRNANRRTTIVLSLAFSVLLLTYLLLVRPPADFPAGKLVTIPEGASLAEAARILHDEHAVRSSLALRLFVVALGRQHTIQAGDYLFKEPEDVFSVAKKISIGAFGLEPTRFLVPEGATAKQMAAIFSSALQRFDSERFVSKAQPLEGHLFPDTYFFLPNATEDTVINALRQNFEHQLQTPVTGSTTLAELIAESGYTREEIVTIASILEREAHNTADRRTIAGVIYNRLKKKMPLQMDVTFLYTIGKGTFDLTLADLASDSPYNTYKHPGLPPTPIGSPSLDSLIAAVTPTKSNYLYFLADHTGITHFCADWECQKANKAKYF